jgi:glutamine amidotransferase
MGWNNVDHHGHWLFEGVEPGSSFYFVHSYYPSPANPYAAIAWTDYGDTFASAIERSSLVAVQFHPEKSGLAGLTVLNNYLRHVGATTAAVPE